MIRYGSTPVGREWFDRNIPCMTGCPVSTNAGRYVAAIAAGDDLGAYLTARAPNPLPSICGQVCAAPCEITCRRGLLDDPVAIRALKRYACESCGVESDVSDRHWREAVQQQPRREERIAIVGAGPAGLSCAHDLAAFGYRPVVLEAADRPGGMMVLGIPTYRLSRDVLEAEIQAILDLGVELRTGVALGRDVALTELRKEFDAVFLACGATRSRDLKIPGVELDGVLRAVEFLINANQGFRAEIGERVVVIGGGNVALDVARTALRADVSIGTPPDEGASRGDGRTRATTALDAARMAVRMGARTVIVVSLEARDEMPASEFEIEEAVLEGVELRHRLGPERILGDGGAVAGLEMLSVASVFDEEGRFAPRFVDGSESVIPCDSVVMAIGQTPDLSWLDPMEGIDVSPGGTIAVDADTLSTTGARVFAGGDVAFGPRNLIDAVADGRRAAASIHQALTGATHATSVERRLVRRSAPIERPVAEYEAVPRVNVPSVPMERRIGMPQVELGYSEGSARLEAVRCLQCFENVMLDTELCILCGGCVDICPEHCLRIVNSSRLECVDASGPSSALVIQEDFCIRCGLCVARCPTGALWMGEWVDAAAPVTREAVAV